MIRRLRWPILVALVALVAIAALLLGQQPVLQPVTQAVVEPATGGVYAEGLIGSLVRLNPLLDYYNPVDRDLDRLLFNGLVRFDDRGLPQGDLAESWGIARDGLVYNFSLRSNATWHDGQPVSSDDVIFTIDMLRSADSPIPDDIRTLWQGIEVIRLDDQTLQFRLPEPFAPFLDYLTFGIAPAHILGDLTLQQIIDSSYNLAPIGTGPYRFDRLIVEDGKIAGVSLVAFTSYFEQPPFIEQIAFRYYPDSQSALAAYRAGDVLGIGNAPLEILPDVLSEPKLDLHTGRLPQLSMILLNLQNPDVPFFQNASLRLALLQGLNRQRMIDRQLSGQAILADGPIFPGVWAYYDGLERVEYIPDAALELLKQAEYTIPASGGSVRVNKDGIPFSFELAYVDDAAHQGLAEFIQQDWARLGIDVKLVPMDFESLSSALNQRTYQAALVDLNLARSPDPDPYPFWHQAQASNGQNYSQWDDRQASEYLEQARITVDLEERTRLYHNFQVRYARELPALPLFYPVYRYAVSADISGVRMGPLFDPSDRFATLSSWYLVTRRSDDVAVTPGAALTPTP